MKKPKWSKSEEGFINNYMEYDIEELECMIENPNEIETGCRINCDRCIDYELSFIREAYRRKELADEHLREP